MVTGSLASVTELLHYTISEVPGLVSLQHYSHSRIRQMVVESERNGDSDTRMGNTANDRCHNLLATVDR